MPGALQQLTADYPLSSLSAGRLLRSVAVASVVVVGGLAAGKQRWQIEGLGRPDMY